MWQHDGLFLKTFWNGGGGLLLEPGNLGPGNLETWAFLVLLGLGILEFLGNDFLDDIVYLMCLGGWYILSFSCYCKY